MRAAQRLVAVVLGIALAAITLPSVLGGARPFRRLMAECSATPQTPFRQSSLHLSDTPVSSSPPHLPPSLLVSLNSLLPALFPPSFPPPLLHSAHDTYAVRVLRVRLRRRARAVVARRDSFASHRQCVPTCTARSSTPYRAVQRLRYCGPIPVQPSV